ncbi:hypothetical protein pb186bvf_008709 [Paramecium bursaria]
MPLNQKILKYIKILKKEINQMLSLEQRAENMQCLKPGHEKPIVMICLQPECQNDRKLCISCIEEFHSAHRNQCAVISEIEDFIVKNSVKAKGTGLANEIIILFKQFKEDINKQLDLIDELLKYKIQNLYLQLNQNNQIRQEGDVEEEEQQLIKIQQFLKANLQQSMATFNQQIDEIKFNLKPLNISVKRLLQTDKQIIHIKKKQLYCHVINPQHEILFQGFTSPQIAQEKKDNEDTRSKPYQFEFNIYEKLNLSKSILKENVIIDHQQLKDGVYRINLKQPILLKPDQYTVSLELKDADQLGFESYKIQSADSTILKFQEAIVEKKNFVQAPDGFDIINEIYIILLEIFFLAQIESQN